MEKILNDVFSLLAPYLKNTNALDHLALA